MTITTEIEAKKTYETTINRIANASSPGEKIDAMTAGIGEIVYQYNKIDDFNVKGGLLKIIFELSEMKDIMQELLKR